MTYNNIVKLADVEYAKRIGQTTGGHHEIRTVSPFSPGAIGVMNLTMPPGHRGFYVHRGTSYDVHVPTPLQRTGRTRPEIRESIHGNDAATQSSGCSWPKSTNGDVPHSVVLQSP